MELPEQKMKSRRGRKSKEPEITGPPTFAFHRQYVKDVSKFFPGEKIIQDEWKKLKKSLQKSSMKSWRLTRFQSSKVAYVVPQVQGRMSFVRSLVLSRLDQLISLQEEENKKFRGNRN